MSIPSRDADLRDWAVNLDTLITAAPATYGLVAADATTIHTYVSDFTAKLTVAVDPTTRTKVAVAAKDGAKAAMLDIVRPYVAQIKANRGVSDDAKLALGIALDDPTRTPVPAPTTAPQLQVAVSGSMVHNLRFADATTPNKRARPAGVIGLQLFVATSSTPPAGPAAASFYAFVTRQNFLVMFDAAQVGKTAYYYARWQNTKGEVGPWSVLTGVTVAA